MPQGAKVGAVKTECHLLVRWQVGRSFWMHEAVSTFVLHGCDDGPHSERLKGHRAGIED